MKVKAHKLLLRFVLSLRARNYRLYSNRNLANFLFVCIFVIARILSRLAYLHIK